MKLSPVDVSCYGGVKLPTLSPHVLISNEVSLRTCGDILLGMQAGQAAKSGVYNSSEEVVNEHHRASDAITVSTELAARVESILTSAVTRLCAHQIEAKSIWLSEPLQFLRYRSDNAGHFLTHTDSAYFDAEGRFNHTSPQRMLTAVLYLNDEFEGGEIEFCSVTDDTDKPLRIKPFPGALTIFPSDLRFPHEVKRVTSGVRCCVVAWFNVAWRA